MVLKEKWKDVVVLERLKDGKKIKGKRLNGGD